MQHTKPADFLPPAEWCKAEGAGVLHCPKLLSYHTHPIQKELIRAGAMAKVGARTYFHKELFWPEFQRLQAEAE